MKKILCAFASVIVLGLFAQNSFAQGHSKLCTHYSAQGCTKMAAGNDRNFCCACFHPAGPERYSCEKVALDCSHFTAAACTKMPLGSERNFCCTCFHKAGTDLNNCEKN